MLFEKGINEFVYQTISKRTVSAKKLCSAFGVQLPAWAEDGGESIPLKLLGLAIARELEKRRRLPQYRSIDDAAKLLNESSKIIVITGAGVSTSLGIPDFRSKHTGFYSKLREQGFEEPEEVFDIHRFDEDPSVFYNLAGEIVPDLKKWTPTHQFIHLIQEKGKLLTNYTQNIDNIESNAGIQPDKLIQCHGSWATATCRKCGYRVEGHEIFEDVHAKRVAQCKQCVERLKLAPKTMKRKRSSNGSKKRRVGSHIEDDSDDDSYDIPQPGVMKPDITFFGEPLPSKFFTRLRDEDRTKVDLVIVIGTSMKVAPVSEIPRALPPSVPQIYISRDPIHHIEFDINLIGDCDTVVHELTRRAGWNLKHEMLDQDAQILAIPDPEGTKDYETVVRKIETIALD